MKVRYTKQYTDSHGDTFKPGWIAEHSEPDSLHRISLGVCVEVTEDGAKSLRIPEEKPVFTECASPQTPEDNLPLRQKAVIHTNEKGERFVIGNEPPPPELSEDFLKKYANKFRSNK